MEKFIREDCGNPFLTREPEDLPDKHKRNSMEKGSDGRDDAPVGALFAFGGKTKKEERLMKKDKKPVVISIRKSCMAEGTGLSHYILMDRKGK